MKQDASPQDRESGKKLRELLAKQEEGTLRALYAEYTAKARHTGSLVWVIGAVFIPLSLSGLALTLQIEGLIARVAVTCLSATLILLWLFISEVLHARFKRDATIRAVVESHMVGRADSPFTRGLEDLVPIRLPVRRARWIITGILLLLCVVWCGTVPVL